MRAVLSLRTVAAVVALLLLTAALRACLPTRDPVDASSTPGVTHHRIDLVTPVAHVVPAPGFAISFDGRATADLSLVIDAQRTMVITAGTPGESTCPPESTKCVVAVDLLGDAVLWFSLVEGSGTKNLELPATVELLDDGHVVLANGWEVPHAYRVKRECDEETASLTAFIQRFGTTATTTFDLESHRVVQVTCPS